MLRRGKFQVVNSHVPEADTLDGLKFFDWMLSSQDNIDIYLFGIDGVNYKKLDNMKYADLPDVDGTVNYRRRWYVAGVPGQFERVPEQASESFMKTLKVEDVYVAGCRFMFETGTHAVSDFSVLREIEV